MARGPTELFSGHLASTCEGENCRTLLIDTLRSAGLYSLCAEHPIRMSGRQQMAMRPRMPCLSAIFTRVISRTHFLGGASTIASVSMFLLLVVPGMYTMLRLLMQYRVPVSVGPSSKT